MDNNPIRASQHNYFRKDLSTWGWSANYHSLEALEAASHNHELEENFDGKIHVHVDCLTMGLGGYDSWSPSVDEDYLIRPAEDDFHMSVMLFPLDENQSTSSIYSNYNAGYYADWNQLEF